MDQNQIFFRNASQNILLSARCANRCRRYSLGSLLALKFWFAMKLYSLHFTAFRSAWRHYSTERTHPTTLLKHMWLIRYLNDMSFSESLSQLCWLYNVYLHPRIAMKTSGHNEWLGSICQGAYVIVNTKWIHRWQDNNSDTSYEILLPKVCPLRLQHQHYPPGAP